MVKENKIIQVDLDKSSKTPTMKNKLETNVMAKDFRYLEFMDKEFMISTTLEWLQGDDEDLVAKFQWMGHMLLKSATIIRYSKPLISSGARATQEMKDLEEKVTFLRNEKLY